MDRREILKILSFASLSQLFPFHSLLAEDIFKKKVPKSGEMIPAVGMGTWQTFNVGDDIQLRNQRLEVLKAFFHLGGGMIDSSPMYGSSEEVIGYCLKKLGYPKSLFSATKVWTSSKEEGRDQIKASKKLWGVKTLDLEQIHNLVSWQSHLDTLKEKKEKGEIRYIGITTSHGRRHNDLEKIITKEDAIDFVQLTYNIESREVEKRLLPLTKEKKLAVIANRPYGGGQLIKSLQKKALPKWAKEVGASNWADFLLKFIISHPSITCAIPATTKVEHMKENMGAMRGAMPDKKHRKKMIEYVSSI